MNRPLPRPALLLFSLALLLVTACSGTHDSTVAAPKAAAELSLLNVSYDPTRELYEQFNSAFAAHWKAQTGIAVKAEKILILPIGKAGSPFTSVPNVNT